MQNENASQSVKIHGPFKVVASALHSRTALPFVLVLLLAVSMLATSSQLNAQLTMGTISGGVVDRSGAAVVDATVTVTNVANATTRKVTVNSDGAIRSL